MAVACRSPLVLEQQALALPGGGTEADVTFFLLLHWCQVENIKSGSQLLSGDVGLHKNQGFLRFIQLILNVNKYKENGSKLFRR